MPRKKKAKPSETFETYSIEIAGWSTIYSVGMNPERRFGVGPYEDHCAIKITGVFVEPAKLAGRSVEAYVMADRYMSQAITSNEVYAKDPTGVGGLNCRGSNANYLGSIPLDVFSVVVSMLAAGKYKYLMLHGLAMKYGSAQIRYCRFGEEREE